MNLPRLGNAIIINNVSQSMPGSEADVKKLKEAYETVGFDVYVYKDCTVKVIVIFSPNKTRNVDNSKFIIKSRIVEKDLVIILMK